MKLTYSDTVQICAAILIQAVEDYRELLHKELPAVKDKNGGGFSLDEIESFFEGDWCELIIQDGLRLRSMTGSDFIKAAYTL